RAKPRPLLVLTSFASGTLKSNGRSTAIVPKSLRSSARSNSSEARKEPQAHSRDHCGQNREERELQRPDPASPEAILKNREGGRIGRVRDNGHAAPNDCTSDEKVLHRVRKIARLRSQIGQSRVVGDHRQRRSSD